MPTTDFLTQGKAKNSFLGLFRPEENKTQDNAIPPGTLDYPTPMMDLYKQQLQSMPNEANYKSSILRKILAGVAGFSTGNPASAFKTTKSILDEPYDSDLTRWKEQTGTTGELASLEERTQANKAKNYLDLAKYQEDAANGASLRNYRTEQGKKIDTEIPLLGRQSFDDNLNGNRVTVDKDNNIISTIRNNQTPQEKSNTALSLYNGQEKTRAATDRFLHQANRTFDNTHLEPKFQLVNSDLTGKPASVNVNDPEAVAALGQTKATDDEKINREKDLKTFESELSKVSSPEQKNAALAGAVFKVKLDNPAYVKFFDTAGNIKPEASDDPDYPNFRQAISDELNKNLNNGGNKELGNPVNPKGTAPKVRKPEDISDDEAKKTLISKGKVVTPQSIAMAKQIIASGGQ